MSQEWIFINSRPFQTDARLEVTTYRGRRRKFGNCFSRANQKADADSVKLEWNGRRLLLSVHWANKPIYHPLLILAVAGPGRVLKECEL